MEKKIKSTENPIEPVEEQSFETELQTESPEREVILRPAIVGGRCEHCGSSHYVGGEVIEKRDPKTGEVSYVYRGGKWEDIDATTCKHYKNVRIACSYCGEHFTGAKNKAGKFTEILGNRAVYVISFADTPNKLTMWCDSFECKHKHLERMKTKS